MTATAPRILADSHFVDLAGIAFGAIGEDATPVDEDHPLPVSLAGGLDGLMSNTKGEQIRVALAGVLASLQASVSLSATLWTDDTNAFFVRRDIVDTDGGGVTTIFTNPAGTTVTPGANVRPASNEEALVTLEALYSATAGGTGYSIGDLLARQVVVNQNSIPPSVVAAVWINLTSGSAIVAPSGANIVREATPLPSGAATAAAQATILAALQAATPAGEFHLGEVGGNTGAVSATPVVQAAAYAAGQCIGGKLTFTNLARITGGSGLAQMALVQSKIANTAPMDLIVFHTDPVNSTFTDKTALALNVADFDKVAATFHINDWTSLGTPSFGRSLESQSFNLPAGQRDGFGVLVARGAVTFSSTSDVKAVVKPIRD